jgi:hypothetical protein
MDQRSIYLFLAFKRLSARAVDNKLIAVLGADAIADSIVTKCIRQRYFTSILVDSHQERAMIIIDQAILDAIEQYAISSIRQLAHFTWIPATTIHRNFTQSLDFVMGHLRWVPHTLTPTQRLEWATLSIELLHHLRSIEHDGWQFIIILDESWFYLSTDNEQSWLCAEEHPPERPRHIIKDPKMMVTIA